MSIQENQWRDGISSDLSELKTDVKWIKENLGRMDGSQRILEKKVSWLKGAGTFVSILLSSLLALVTSMMFTGCSTQSNLIKDQEDNIHDYKKYILFSQDSTQQWCYTHERFEIIKKVDSYTKMRNRINDNIELQDLANSWRIF
tara:strand:- start:19853 stop:20284 length:432 start_codon:yes stop_codon:yes gene_type:complete